MGPIVSLSFRLIELFARIIFVPLHWVFAQAIKYLLETWEGGRIECSHICVVLGDWKWWENQFIKLSQCPSPASDWPPQSCNDWPRPALLSLNSPFLLLNSARLARRITASAGRSIFAMLIFWSAPTHHWPITRLGSSTLSRWGILLVTVFRVVQGETRGDSPREIVCVFV